MKEGNNYSIHLMLSMSSQDYTAKLSDFGLAKAGPQGDETHVSTRVMGTYGYAAPEYVMTGMASHFLVNDFRSISRSKTSSCKIEKY